VETGLRLVAQTFGALVFLGLVVVQWVAEVAGLHDVLGWSSFACRLVATLTAWIPVLGTAAGVWGAHIAWAWHWIRALALFGGIPLVAMLLVGIATAIDDKKPLV
jgi:hypothetical protein